MIRQCKFMLAADASLFAARRHPAASFAGVSRQADGGARFGLPTTEFNSLAVAVHLKAMPVLLHDKDEEAWQRAPIKAAMRLVAPNPAQLKRLR